MKIFGPTLTLVCTSLIVAHLAAARFSLSPVSLPHVQSTACPRAGVGEDELLERVTGYQTLKRKLQRDLKESWCSSRTSLKDSSSVIGCCNAASGALRTTCTPYNSVVASPRHLSTGRCTYCSDSASPACLTESTEASDQGCHDCAPLSGMEMASYNDRITIRSLAEDTSLVVISSPSGNGDFTPQPAMCRRPPCSIAKSSVTIETPTTTPSYSHMVFTYEPTPVTTSVAVTTSSTQHPTSASSPAATTSSTAVPVVDDNRKTSDPGLSNGAVAGIVCAAAAGTALTAAVLCRTKHKWLALLHIKRNGKPSTKNDDEEDSPHISDPCTESKKPSDRRSPKKVAFKDFANAGPRMSVASPKANERFEMHGLGIDIRSPRRSALKNSAPEPASAIDAGTGSKDLRWPFLQSGNRDGAANSDLLLPSSPSLSCLQAPQPPSSPTTDASLPSYGGIAPASPVTPTPGYRCTAYTPSMYGKGGEAPSSLVPRRVSAPPPSLPQEYSAITLPSMANIYRGLGMRDDPLWAYLGPEDLVNRGQRDGEV